MSKSKIRTIVIILFALTAFWMIIKNAVTGKSLMINPMAKEVIQAIPSNTPTPVPSTPKTFKFDSKTDLKEQLEQVNPQVLDSDFE